MRFRTKQKPRGLIDRRHQVRLTLMLAALGAVLIGSRIVGQPDFWAGMFPDSQPAGQETTAEPAVAHTAFRPNYIVDGSSSPVRPLTDRLQNTIEDNVIGVTADESQAWFASMGLAERITSTQAKQLPKARYALFMEVPDECRGQAWTLTGKLRRMTKERMTNDSKDYKDVFDAWMSLPDSGDSLVHVVALDAGLDLRPADDYGDNPPEVSVSGYFFKREAYASGADSGISIAPLVLAGRITRVPAPELTSSRADQLTPWLGWLAVVTCGGLCLVVWSFASSDAVNRSQRTHELTRLPSSPSFEGVSIETTHETLHQLETAAEAAPAPLNIDQL